MTDIETLRERIQAAQQPRKGRRKTFEPPTMDDFAPGCVVALDQTLTKCGWVLIEYTHGGLMIHEGGVIRPEAPGLKGFEETYAKAADLAKRLENLASMAVPWACRSQVEAWVHEMPAVKGYRLESSLMAGREIRRVMERETARASVVMISRQHAYSVLVGAPSTHKATGTKAINRLVPPECRSTSAWNQDVHDAALLGATYLYDKKRAAG